MNFVLLPLIARLTELPSKYRAVAGIFSDGRSRHVVLWAGAKAQVHRAE